MDIREKTMKRPTEIESRIDREIVIGVQSFNAINSEIFLSELHDLVTKWHKKQEDVELKDYVWVNTYSRWAKLYIG